MRYSGLLIAFLAIVMISCLKDKTTAPVPEGDCMDTILFHDEILEEIMDVSCNTVGCHDDASAAGGYIWLTHDQISMNTTLIKNAINHTAGTAMPLGGTKLVDSLLKKFDCWVEQGAMDN